MAKKIKGENGKVYKEHKPFYKKVWFWILAIIGIFILVGYLNSPVETSKPQKESDDIENLESTAESSEEEELISDGTYKIGTDIPAGEYRILQLSSDGGYLEVAKDSKNVLDSIITNDNFHGGRYLTLEEGQYFTLRNAFALAIEDDGVNFQHIKPNEIIDQQFLVGLDIEPGEYKIATDNGPGYIEVSANSKHQLDDILTNENLKENSNTFITVEDGQYLTIKGAKIIK